jgi:hypothetical protein
VGRHQDRKAFCARLEILLQEARHLHGF